jgi:hypothetical protein
MNGGGELEVVNIFKREDTGPVTLHMASLCEVKPQTAANLPLNRHHFQLVARAHFETYRTWAS